MKALTLTQPWASLVAIGAKKIETRSWNTTYRGPLAIHAAKGFPAWARSLAYHQEPFREVLASHHLIPTQAYGMVPENLPTGFIVATCILVAVHRVDKYDWQSSQRAWEFEHCYWEASEQEKAFGDYSIGRYMWFLKNIVALPEPVAAKGALSLWECGLTPHAPDKWGKFCFGGFANYRKSTVKRGGIYPAHPQVM